MKVGDKAKGFKFEDRIHNGVRYHKELADDYIGKTGKVTCLFEHSYQIEFKDGFKYSYPLSVVDQWQPKQGEMIEVSHDGEYWYEREFIAKHKGKFLCETLSESVYDWKHARPINTIQREIDELQAKIDELKKRL